MRRQQAGRQAEASTQVASIGDQSIDAMRAKAEEMRRRVAEKKAKKQAAKQRASAEDGRPPEPPAPWRLVAHPSSPGEWYYHNEETGETAWDPPGGVEETKEETEPVWRRVEHPSEPGTFYYHNAETGETSWDVPAGFEDIADTGSTDESKRDDRSGESLVQEEQQDAADGAATSESADAEEERDGEAEGASQAEVGTSSKEKDEEANEKETELSEGADDSAVADTADEVVDAKDEADGAGSAEERDDEEKLQQGQPDIGQEAASSQDSEQKEAEAPSSSAVEAKPEQDATRVQKATAKAKVGFAARLFGSGTEEAEVEVEEDKKEEEPYVPLDEEALSRENARANSSLEIMKDLGLRRRLLMQARRAVMRGSLEKTPTGLTQDDLIVNKNGRIVSRKKSEQGKMMYAKYLKGWQEAVGAARSALDISGFVAVGGPSEMGQKLYKKAKEFYSGNKEKNA